MVFMYSFNLYFFYYGGEWYLFTYLRTIYISLCDGSFVHFSNGFTEFFPSLFLIPLWSGPPSLANGLTQITKDLCIAKANQQFSVLILPMSRFWHGWSRHPSWNISLCLAQAEIFLGNLPTPSHYCSPGNPERSMCDNQSPYTYQSPAAGCAQSHGKW